MDDVFGRWMMMMVMMMIMMMMENNFLSIPILLVRFKNCSGLTSISRFNACYCWLNSTCCSSPSLTWLNLQFCARVLVASIHHSLGFVKFSSRAPGAT